MTEMRLLKEGDQRSLEAFLLPRLATSMFLIGNSRRSGLVDHDERFQGTYAAAFEAGEMVGVAAHYEVGNIILQAPAHAAELAAFAFSKSKRALAGFIGPSAQVGSALEALRIAPSALRLDSIEELFELPLAQLRVPEAIESRAVRVRFAREADIPLLLEWRVLYDIEASNEQDCADLRRRILPWLERGVRDACMWIAERDGTPVAMTAFNTVIEEAAQIGGVFTPKEERSQGYARCAVAQSLLDARVGGIQTGLLFTGEDNFAAQHAYRSLGFERIGDYRLSFLSTPRRQLTT